MSTQEVGHPTRPNRPSIYSAREWIGREVNPVPPGLLDAPYEEAKCLDAPVTRYTSRDYAAKERDHVWRKVWQMACRVEDIPEVGDRLPYNVGEDSIMIVRTAPNEIKAFVNACLHRGRVLCEHAERGTQIRCPFHGFTWSLDGRLKQIPEWWDFPHGTRDKFSLPEVKVEVYAGFVFINMQENPPPLSDYLEVLPEHLKTWRYGDRVKVAHVSKRLRCNWKLAMEAFTEPLHVIFSHPQMAGYAGDYEMSHWGRHISRLFNVIGLPHPLLKGALDEDGVFQDIKRDFPLDDLPESLPAGATARGLLAEKARKQVQREWGWDMSSVTDTELIDGIGYFVFPNTIFWPSFFLPIVHRWRPYGDNPAECVMDTMVIIGRPEGTERPVRIEPTELGFDQSFAEASEFGDTGRILDQDVSNIESCQRGLGITRSKTVILSRYLESINRRIHDTLDHYVGDDDREAPRTGGGAPAPSPDIDAYT